MTSVYFFWSDITNSSRHLNSKFDQIVSRQIVLHSVTLPHHLLFFWAVVFVNILSSCQKRQSSLHAVVNSQWSVICNYSKRQLKLTFELLNSGNQCQENSFSKTMISLYQKKRLYFFHFQTIWDQCGNKYQMINSKDACMPFPKISFACLIIAMPLQPFWKNWPHHR